MNKINLNNPVICIFIAAFFILIIPFSILKSEKHEISNYRDIHKKYILFNMIVLILVVIAFFTTFIIKIIYNNNSFSILILVTGAVCALTSISLPYCNYLANKRTISETKDKILKLDYMHLNDEQITDILNYKYTYLFDNLKEKITNCNDEEYKNDILYRLSDLEYIASYDYEGKPLEEDKEIVKLKYSYYIFDVSKIIEKILTNNKFLRHERDEYNRIYNDDYYIWFSLEIRKSTSLQ